MSLANPNPQPKPSHASPSPQVFGLALDDFYVWIPNVFGLVLGAMQISLLLLYPASSIAGGYRAVSASDGILYPASSIAGGYRDVSASAGDVAMHETKSHA